ncbi:MAG TPA: CGNR zinc finger domain-containing protein [Streptomyces sp.]|uniref:CGNR zinc finger domain-containing protein n=1 Tax=Streptomyces sp. TaxID=1931 RepID=UPI002D66D5AD|nr:CGNR zinc finger domain-containing protein [Streptomyces sp.]HZG05495.1 CGNR zinc finger domain-containing protein [Streptomyces sp.]
MTESATGLVLHSPEGVPYRFDPGALCLELLPTGGPGEFARHEVLHEPVNLVVWASRSRLRPSPVVEVTEVELAAARELRAALWRMAVDQAHGRTPRPEDVEVVNDTAAGPPLPVRLLRSDGGAGWARDWGPAATGAQLLSTVARDAVDLFGGPYAHRIRECASEDCYLVFVDTSRPGRRRWCSMERCGNRHKVRALRARREEE